MQHLSIETLLLTDDERKIAKNQIEDIAYLKWIDAGRPETDPCKFWYDAELEWTEYFYIPDRYEYDEERTTVAPTIPLDS